MLIDCIDPYSPLHKAEVCIGGPLEVGDCGGILVLLVDIRFIEFKASGDICGGRTFTPLRDVFHINVSV
jgi:hypothetical protein